MPRKDESPEHIAEHSPYLSVLNIGPDPLHLSVIGVTGLLLKNKFADNKVETRLALQFAESERMLILNQTNINRMVAFTQTENTQRWIGTHVTLEVVAMRDGKPTIIVYGYGFMPSDGRGDVEDVEGTGRG